MARYEPQDQIKRLRLPHLRRYAKLALDRVQKARQETGDDRGMTFNRVAHFSALLLISAVLNNLPAHAAGNPPGAAAIKERIAAHGVGQGVEVTLASGTEAKGTIVSIGDQSFALRAKGADQPRSIEYAQVTDIHGDGFSTGTKVGLAVGILMVVLLVSLASIAKEEASLAKQI